MNYDLPALTAKQIADLLPREFELFRRPQASTAFVYLGKLHVGALTARPDGAWDVEFRLLKPQ